MCEPTPKIVTLSAESATAAAYDNHAIAAVNDHVVRISIMTGAYRRHRHPNSDATFLVVEGGFAIELAVGKLRLEAGQMTTIPKGMPHGTRPIGDRSVNITVEAADLETVYEEG